LNIKTIADASPVWFITGCATGFGRAIAEHILGLGYQAVVTARNPAQIEDLSIKHSGVLVQALDVTDQDQVIASVEAAKAHFGGVDVLVNNAGIGYFGAVEESGGDDVRSMFETNFWGAGQHDASRPPSHAPGKKRNDRQHVINGRRSRGRRGCCYNASKFAVEGFSEALSQKVAPIGIKVVLVEQSGFRTDRAGRSAKQVERPIEDYDDTAGLRRRQIRMGSGLRQVIYSGLS
jgi:NAD(P)-dependent dehydrogenase (short-subunit alcohol dehydrogenase family)